MGKSELFQEDLYPETQADIPAITAEEWWVQRKNADPVLMSMADGGGSNSQSEELVVKKATPNVLNKAATVGSSSASSAAVAPAASAGIIEAEMKKFKSMVLDECSRLVADSQEKSNTKVEELNSEIRKLKAMIVKHETRIRTLETKNKEQEKMLISNGIMLNNNGHSGEDMDPDEV